MRSNLTREIDPIEAHGKAVQANQAQRAELEAERDQRMGVGHDPEENPIELSEQAERAIRKRFKKKDGSPDKAAGDKAVQAAIEAERERITKEKERQAELNEVVEKANKKAEKTAAKAADKKKPKPEDNGQAEESKTEGK